MLSNVKRILVGIYNNRDTRIKNILLSKEKIFDLIADKRHRVADRFLDW